MRIYYFIHLTGRDPGNSGIQRVVRNLGTALQHRGGVDLVPVRWCADRARLVHAEPAFQERIRLYNGPQFEPSDRDGSPIHEDAADDGGAWLLIPEAPHLGSHDADYPATHLPYVVGYARRHGIKVAAIVHDIMPLSHFGKDRTDEIEPLKWVIYANALALVDVLLPVSRASGAELTNWFGRNGIGRSRDLAVHPLLLPEEMVGIACRRFLETPDERDVVQFCMWGSVHRHKNQLIVLEAFVALRERRPDLNLHLHLFGHVMGDLASRVAHAARQARGTIHLHGFVDDARMLATIATCRASIFLSLAEGYGLPVAESLWLGKPCLTSALAPMTEIAAAGGCLLADPADRQEISDAIEVLATNEAVLDGLKREIAERPMRSWSDYAGEVCDVLAATPSQPYEPYRPADVKRKPILVEMRPIPVSTLHLKEVYRQAEWSLLEGAALRYDRSTRGAAAERVLAYGPYIDVSSGWYNLRLLGELRGTLRVQVTLGMGRVTVGEWFFQDRLDAMEFGIDSKGQHFEILILKEDETQLLVLENIALERYVSGGQPPGRLLHG